MKKLLLFCLVGGAVVSLVLVVWFGYQNMRNHIPEIESIEELDELPDGKLGMGDFLFIDETTTLQDIIDRNGPPDAVRGLRGSFPRGTNLVYWYYKLSDGGVFSCAQPEGPGVIENINHNESLMIVNYRDFNLKIFIYAPEDYINWLLSIDEYPPEGQRVIFLVKSKMLV